MSPVKKTVHEFDAIIPSPVGMLGLKFADQHLSSLRFLPDEQQALSPENPLLRKTIRELKAYFKNPQHGFELDLLLQGTPFQQAVWKELQRIPQGETRSYQDLALKLKTSPRAVGNACRANPVAIIVPCHRVLAKSGLGGFCGQRAGKYLKIKTWLLDHEGIVG